MKKSFFLRFGSPLDVKKVCSHLQDRLDLTFVQHNSSYFGEYSKYSGLYADSLIVGPNFVVCSGDWREPNQKQFITIVEVSITSGKNSDKLSKCKYLKNSLKQIAGLTLIEERTLEAPA